MTPGLGSINRVLGLPGWFAPSVMDAATPLWIPRFGLDIAQTLVEELGPPRAVDVALGLSGRGLCLVEYETQVASQLLSLDLRAFIALWARSESAIEDTEPWRRTLAPLTLWLENTPATQKLCAADGSVIELGQRNGEIKIRRIRIPDPAVDEAEAS